MNNKSPLARRSRRRFSFSASISATIRSDCVYVQPFDGIVSGLPGPGPGRSEQIGDFPALSRRPCHHPPPDRPFFSTGTNCFFWRGWNPSGTAGVPASRFTPGPRSAAGWSLTTVWGLSSARPRRSATDVLIYHGVTLGGTGKDRGKRHPTIGQ